MRSVVLQMGISIDGYVSDVPGEDFGDGEPEHATPYPDGTVISNYRRPR